MANEKVHVCLIGLGAVGGYDGLIEKMRAKELELTTFDQSSRKAY